LIKNSVAFVLKFILCTTFRTINLVHPQMLILPVFIFLFYFLDEHLKMTSKCRMSLKNWPVSIMMVWSTHPLQVDLPPFKECDYPKLRTTVLDYLCGIVLIFCCFTVGDCLLWNFKFSNRQGTRDHGERSSMAGTNQNVSWFKRRPHCR